MKKLFLLFSILFLQLSAQPIKTESLTSKLIKLDSDLPGNQAKLFAPNKISTPLVDWGITMSSDGNEIYFTVSNKEISAIVGIYFENGIWSNPEIVSFSGQYKDFSPNISKDGNRIIFGSKRPTSPADTVFDGNYWCVERKNGFWGEPFPLENVNSDHNESFLFMHQNGDLYFCRRKPVKGEKTRIFHSKYQDGKYQKPVKLKWQIDSKNGEYCPYVFPSGDKMILELVNEKDGYGGGDMYLSKKDGEIWSKPINLGKQVNSDKHDCFPIVSPDGKYLIFMSSRKFELNNDENKNTFNKLLWNSVNVSDDMFDFYWIKLNSISLMNN